MLADVDLPDANVWLALAFEDHEHHDRARRYWFEEASGSIAFCRITALGLLRLTTNATVMGGAPLSVTEAWSGYEKIRGRREVTLVDEPAGCEVILGTWATSGAFARRGWTDAYLAALARAAGVRLVSFDRGFARYPELQWLHLAP